EAGKQLAENNDRAPDQLDPRLEFAPPADGDYVIRLQEVVPQRCLGPKFIYRLTIREAMPDFRLTLKEPTVFTKPGDSTVAIDVERLKGFDGAIQASIQALPGDIKAEPATIAKGQNKGTLPISVPAGHNGKHFPITVVGKAQAGDKMLTHLATARVA